MEATQAVLRRQLALKFGPLDPAVETRIAEATLEQVERYLERFATRSSTPRLRLGRSLCSHQVALDEILDD